MPGLDSPFYPALWQLAIATGTRPEVFLCVWWEESGLNPGIVNSVGCAGLNQSCPTAAESGGKTGGPGYPAGYTSWPASQQVSQWIAGQVKSAIASNGGPFKSAARYLQANFLPATLPSARAPGDIICAKAGPYASAYKGNAQFDMNKDGTITLADLGDYLAEHCGKPQYHNGNLTSAIATTYAAANLPGGAPWAAALVDPYHEPSGSPAPGPGPQPHGPPPPLPQPSPALPLVAALGFGGLLLKFARARGRVRA